MFVKKWMGIKDEWPSAGLHTRRLLIVKQVLQIRKLQKQQGWNSVQKSIKKIINLLH